MCWNDIKYPVGIQTFQKIIEDHYLYVDKTELIYNLANRNSYVFLGRPRRFGKSLLVSTLEAYFRARKELFKGLAIEKLEKDWIEYPVLRLDLSRQSYFEADHLEMVLSNSLKRWEKEYHVTEIVPSPASRLENVIIAAYEQTGRKVVILVDEYDKPILSTLHESEKKESIRAELQGFYSVIKSCDEYIKFVLLTGVSKFAHLSIFSGFNNLYDISMDPKYNAICGITEKEFRHYFKQSVINYASSHDMSEERAWSDFKHHYDGYHFSEVPLDIYNPFSLLNAFHRNLISDYWFATGTPSFLVRLVRHNHFPLTRLANPQRTRRRLSDITDSSRDIVPMLFQAGYLTIRDWDKDTDTFTLDFPNIEVRKGFWESFVDAYFPVGGSPGGFDMIGFLKEINLGEAERFMLALQSMLASANSENEPDKEIHFQNMMAIIFYMLGLSVRTEIHSAVGRCDMVLETDSYIYIFEFKINGTPEEALAQIKEKGYALPYLADRREKILIGANFSTRTRTLTGWIIER